MSTWAKCVEIEEDDIDWKEKEVDLFISQDNAGSNYLTISFDQVKFLYEKIFTPDVVP